MLFSLTIVCILESKSMTCFLYLISKWFVMFSLVFFFVVLFFELLAYSSRILGNRKRVIALRNYSACFGRWLAILRLPNGVTQSCKLVMRQIGFVVLSAFMSLLEMWEWTHGKQAWSMEAIRNWTRQPLKQVHIVSADEEWNVRSQIVVPAISLKLRCKYRF